MNLNNKLITGGLILTTLFAVFAFGLIAGSGIVNDTGPSQPTAPDHNHINPSEPESQDSSTGSQTNLEPALNGTVTIYIEKGDQLAAQGSGFVYKKQYIMTNDHVINQRQAESDSSDTPSYEGDKTVYIKYADSSWTEATVVGSDRFSDIAVLEPARVPDFANSLTLSENTPEQGEKVYALGAPLGYSDSITSGIVSATGRSMRTAGNFTIPDTVQTDAEIDSGNSGGPLVLASNPTTVVGVNRAKQGGAIGFAVSGRLSSKVGNHIIENGEFNHTYIGISGRELTPVIDGYDSVSLNRGIVIEQVLDDTPAGGNFEGRTDDGEIEDVIIGVEGEQVSDLEDLSRIITLQKNVGDEAEFTVYNDGETRNVTITLESRDKYVNNNNDNNDN